jgi:hypothetical protein
MTLTLKQIEALRLVAVGKVRYVRFGTGAWRIVGANPTTVGRLMQTLKLVEHGEMIVTNLDYYPFVLTALGRQALAETSAS